MKGGTENISTWTEKSVFACLRLGLVLVMQAPSLLTK